MSATAFFFRTLVKASAVFAGAMMIFLNPSLEWRSNALTSVDAQLAPREAAIAGLTAALKDSDAGVRKQAAVALAQLDARSAVGALIQAVGDQNVEVRRAVVHALGELGDASAVEAVTRALKDADAGVRRAAAMALANLADEDSHPRPHPRPRPIPDPSPVIR